MLHFLLLIPDGKSYSYDAFGSILFILYIRQAYKKHNGAIKLSLIKDT
jgi:hypothetical protein